MGIDPVTHRPRTDLSFLANLPQFLVATAANITAPNWDISNNNVNNNNINDNTLTEATQIAKIHLLHNILQLLNTPPSNLEAINHFGCSSWDNQINEYLRINSQLEGNNYLIPFGFAPQELSLSNQSNLPNSVAHHLSHDHHQVLKDSKLVYTSNDDHHLGSSNISPCLSANIQASNPLPSLVSASSEPSTINQNENKLNSNHISNPTSTSTTFGTWDQVRHLLDDEAGDSYWTDIIE